MITRNNSSGGFTLIEVLIALAITALIATLSFTSLTTVLDSVESVREARTRITEVNRFWNLISRDLRQMVDRPVRNEFGEAEASFWGGADAENSLHFTRTGWHNPNDHTRSNMQRVAYRLEDETLWRDSYLVLDRTSETEPQSVALLEGVQLFEMLFMRRGTQVSLQEIDTDDWAEDWNLGTDSADGEPPAALEIRLELEGWGEIRRLYELPGG
jgi:general secretion pathway protein J